MNQITDGQTVHATCVAWQARAVLIMGRSGQGKSALGLELMSMGCRLIADDRVLLSRLKNQVIASCPDAISSSVLCVD
jgi:HPr kinase/phosphorylase